MGSIAGVQPPGDPAEEPPRQDELLSLEASSSSKPLIRIGVTKLGVRAKPDKDRADASGDPETTRYWDLIFDGRVEIGPAATIAESKFGGEFTDSIIQVAPHFGFVLPSGLWLSTKEAARTKLGPFTVEVSRVGFGSAGRSRSGSGSTRGLTSARASEPPPRSRACGSTLAAHPEPTLRSTASSSTSTGRVSTSTASSRCSPDPIPTVSPIRPTGRSVATSRSTIASGVGVKLEGSVLFGSKDGTRFGYVALDAVFGSGIPIFASVSWFGAALLAGVNVTPDKTLTGNHGDDFNWYQHWYAASPGPYSVINARKWVPAEDGWAGGAGVAIGSSDGKAWSLKAFLALVVPRPGV